MTIFVYAKSEDLENIEESPGKIIDVVIIKFFDRYYEIVLRTKASEFERVKTESKRD